MVPCRVPPTELCNAAAYAPSIQMQSGLGGSNVRVAERGKDTVRWALGRLQDVGLVEARPNPADARQRIYEVSEGDARTTD